MCRWIRSPLTLLVLIALAVMTVIRPAGVAVPTHASHSFDPDDLSAVEGAIRDASAPESARDNHHRVLSSTPASSQIPEQAMHGVGETSQGSDSRATTTASPASADTSHRAARTVHITVRGVVPKKFAASVKSFYLHGFHVVVWTRDKPQPFLDRIDASIRSRLDVRTMVAYEHGLPDRLLNVVPFQILADHGGWHYSGNYVCLHNVETFVALTRYTPVVMGYDPLRKRPSILAMYFCNRSLARVLADRILTDRTARPPAKIARDALNDMNLFHKLLPMHVLLYGTHAWGVVESNGVPRHHALAVTYDYDTRYPVGLPPNRPRDDADDGNEGCGGLYRPDRVANATLAHFLWLGGELQPMAWCAIDTFVRQGFYAHVWTYDMALKVPDGAVLGNLADHYPTDFRFTITQRGRRGSPSAFSNIFRYHILQLYGGWWFDTDVLCLRPAADFAKLAQERPATVGFEDPSLIDGAVMHFANRTLASVMMARAEQVLALHNRSVEWGMLGPRLITAVLEDLGLSVLGYPEWMFYPVHWTQWQLMFQKQSTRNAEDICRFTYAVHLWNEITKAKVPDAGSFVDKVIGRCSQRHLVLSGRATEEV